MKKKILFSVLLVFAIFFITSFYNVSKATFTITSNTEYFESNSTLTFPDLSEEYNELLKSKPYIFTSYNNKYYRFLILTDGSYFYKKNDDLKIKGSYYLAYNDGSGWTYSQDIGDGTSWSFNNIFYYHADVYSDVNKSNFFYVTPLIVAQAVQRVGAQEMKQVTKEILAILPMILSVLVSLLAFSKGLNLLLSFLRKS